LSAFPHRWKHRSNARRAGEASLGFAPVRESVVARRVLETYVDRDVPTRPRASHHSGKRASACTRSGRLATWRPRRVPRSRGRPRLASPARLADARASARAPTPTRSVPTPRDASTRGRVARSAEAPRDAPRAGGSASRATATSGMPRRSRNAPTATPSSRRPPRRKRERRRVRRWTLCCPTAATSTSAIRNSAGRRS
jgi:hypothetical protein